MRATWDLERTPSGPLRGPVQCAPEPRPRDLIRERPGHRGGWGAGPKRPSLDQRQAGKSAMALEREDLRDAHAAAVGQPEHSGPAPREAHHLLSPQHVLEDSCASLPALAVL